MTLQSSLAVRDDRRPREFRRVRELWVRFTEAHRQRRILGLIALLWFFSTIDLVLTLWADRFTIFYEANPIARAMLARGMITSVVLLKLVTLLAASALFWWTRRRRWTEGVLWALAGGYVLLMFQWSAYTANADELLHYRQMADFAAAPAEGLVSYYGCVRRARLAEHMHAADDAPASCKPIAPQAGSPFFMLTRATPADRTRRTLQLMAELND